MDAIMSADAMSEGNLEAGGVSKGTEWVIHAIERAENEAHMTNGQGCLLVDRCLRKARATWAIKQSLDTLPTEAIIKQQGKDMG